MILVKKLDPEHREDFSDDLERYVQEAATKIIETIDQRHDSDFIERLGFQNLHKTVIETLMENIYIPLVMGDDEL